MLLILPPPGSNPLLCLSAKIMHRQDYAQFSCEVLSSFFPEYTQGTPQSMQTIVASAAVVVVLGAYIYLLVTCELWYVLNKLGSWERSAL